MEAANTRTKARVNPLSLLCNNSPLASSQAALFLSKGTCFLEAKQARATVVCAQQCPCYSNNKGPCPHNGDNVQYLSVTPGLIDPFF